MNIEEATKRVRGAGYAGLCVWNLGGGFNGWLIKPNGDIFYDAVLWNHKETAQEALEGMVRIAEDNVYN